MRWNQLIKRPTLLQRASSLVGGLVLITSHGSLIDGTRITARGERGIDIYITRPGPSGSLRRCRCWCLGRSASTAAKTQFVPKAQAQSHVLHESPHSQTGSVLLLLGPRTKQCIQNTGGDATGPPSKWCSTDLVC